MKQFPFIMEKSLIPDMRIICQIVLCIIVIFSSLGCRTTGAHWRERFLIAHEFHSQDSNIYSRHYCSLMAAGQDLGISIDKLSELPNGPMPMADDEDERIADLHDWVFVLKADKSHNLDDPTAPCTVSTAVIQVHEDNNVTTSGACRDWTFTGSVQERVDRQKEGTNWTTVLVKFDSENSLLNEVQLLYNSTNGLLGLSTWIGKPMPNLGCTPKIPALITAERGKKCRLIFTAKHWDIPTRDKGQISLKSFEWID